MTWVRLDDQFSQHPKVVALSDGAFRVLVDAFCYCGRWNTNGELPKGAVKMPARYVRFVERGNWHGPGHACDSCPPVAMDCFYVHDFLVYNPSSEEVEEQQGRRTEKARRAARARWDKEPGSTTSDAPSMPRALPQGLLGDCSADAPVPVPTTGLSSVSHLQPQVTPPVDDDNFAEFDTASVTVRAVFERCAEAKMKGIADVKNAPAYRARVLADLETTRGADLRSVIARFPDAPVDVLAGHVLGEPNNLHLYRKATA